MFNLLSQFSRCRFSWFLLFLSGIGFESTALYFQHGLKLAPCTLCIYQRLTLIGILVAGLIGFLAPRSLLVRLIALSLWLYSAFEGFNLAYLQARLQFAPSFSDSCSIGVEFPTWLPLDSWFPNVFSAYGYCADKLWSFLTIEMSQWMIIIFSCYFIVGVIILVAQFFRPKRDLSWR